MMSSRAARLAGALTAAAVAVVVVVLPGRGAALAPPNGDSCAPLPVAMTNEEFEDASELPVPLDCNEVAELATYPFPLVAVSERRILEAAGGAPNARAIFREVAECPICYDSMHHNTVQLVCSCGQVMDDKCVAELWAKARPNRPPSCPFCRQRLRRNVLLRPELLAKALKLFEEKRWMPSVHSNNPDELAESLELPETLGEYMMGRIKAQLDFAMMSMLEAARSIDGYDPYEKYSERFLDGVQTITDYARK
ncbi:MAG: hypothetical protein BJ554DRAFT_7384, partial [Olpidium bornovanus]